MNKKKTSAARKRGSSLKRSIKKSIAMKKAASTKLFTSVEFAFPKTRQEKARATAVELNLGQTQSLRDLLKSTGWS
ncbi:MAG: hypothetical protein AABN95_00225 [Acidobacteriota bacterium]